MDVSSLILIFAAMRVVIGLAPIVAARPSLRLLGFPSDHDNATARLMGRLFGVRDIGLGVIAAAGVKGFVPMDFALLFNAATDVGDMVVIAIPLLRRQQIDRAAALSLGFAVAGCSAWLLALSLWGG